MSYSNNKITVFSTVTCAVCATLKRYLKQKGIPYEEVFVDRDQEQMQRMIDISGAMTVPVTLIDDNKVVLGFNPSKIQEALL